MAPTANLAIMVSATETASPFFAVQPKLAAPRATLAVSRRSWPLGRESNAFLAAMEACQGALKPVLGCASFV